MGIPVTPQLAASEEGQFEYGDTNLRLTGSMEPLLQWLTRDVDAKLNCQVPLVPIHCAVHPHHQHF